jgi:nucleoid-associated protein YgaU
LEQLADRWYVVGTSVADHCDRQPHVEPRRPTWPTADPAAPRLNRRRTVVVGDTQWKLAKHNYGDKAHGPTQTLVAPVAAANRIVEWNRLKV